jgi:hypothetical protein
MDASQGLVTPANATAIPAGSRRSSILLRPIWLPRAIYAAVPWVYLASGTGCLFGALYLPDGSWILPYLGLSGVACLHASIVVASLRRPRAPDPVVPPGPGPTS